MVVEELRIVVDTNNLSVPRSVFCDWSDLTSIDLESMDGHSALVARGGDASEAYEVKVQFDAARVLKRIKVSRMDIRHPLEVTNYYEVSLND
jgi:hypothetical protein